jgi:hypothetical protein
MRKSGKVGGVRSNHFSSLQPGTLIKSEEQIMGGLHSAEKFLQLLVNFGKLPPAQVSYLGMYFLFFFFFFFFFSFSLSFLKPFGPS